MIASSSPRATSYWRNVPARWVGWAAAGAWCAVLAFICVRVGLAPTRQSVFAADYAAAGAHWVHGQPLYRGARHFVYSPLAAAMLAPFGVLPAVAGGIAWRLVSVTAFVWAAAAWMETESASFGTAASVRRGGLESSVIFLLLLPLTLGNINVGQMNLLVLAFVAAGVVAAARGQWNFAALTLAAAGYLKIYPLAVGLLLVVMYPRKFAWRLVVAVAFLFAMSLFLQRPTYAWTQYHQWLRPLTRDNRLDLDLFATWRDFGYLLRACGLNISPFAYRSMEVAAGAALAIFCGVGQRRWRWTKAQQFGAVFSLGCAWMVLFGPATEAATYVVLAPAVCVTLVAIWPIPLAQPLARILLAATYVLSLVADLGNSWFRAGAYSLVMRSLQPVAALSFIVAVVLLLRPNQSTHDLAPAQHH